MFIMAEDVIDRLANMKLIVEEEEAIAILMKVDWMRWRVVR